MTNYNLAFAGAGRVAGALCQQMHRSGFNILQIISETATDGEPLAHSCNAAWSRELKFIDSVDIVIVAVPDNKLEEVLSSIKCSDHTVVAHTAGSYGLDIFPAHLRNNGVFYPLQTFSKGRSINFNDLPILIEASKPGTGKILKDLAESIKGKVHFIDVEHRKRLHLAAVFVCNFTNHMLTAGKEITSGAGLSFELLEPLIRETISKALENGPENAQTGPAVRKDLNTIEKHLELLSFSPELQKIYKEVSQSIINHHFNKS